jgi:hypothetical protein
MGVQFARRPVNVFVAATGNGFMRDIADWIIEAAEVSGWTASLVDDRLPQSDGSINLVVAPHEFYLLRDDTDADIRAAAVCSVPICTEQPGTPWFLLSLGFCVGSPLVADINAVGLEAIEAEGFRAHRLRLGGVPQMDRTPQHQSGDADRDIDVIFLGGDTDRRAAALARLGPVLWDRRSEIRLFSSSRPVQGDEPGVVFGRAKYDLLARSKVLVNLHRDDREDGYFEWARMVEAMANGCVVVTDPSIGHDPLVAGQHFVETDVDRLADTVIELLDDPLRRAEIAAQAHVAVMLDHPMSREVAALLDMIEDEQLGVELHVDPPRFRSLRRRPKAIVRGHKPPLLPAFEPFCSERREWHRQMLAEIAHRRDLNELRSVIEHGQPDHVTEFETPAWLSNDRLDVSVIVSLFNYADVVVETLDSIVESTDVDVEIVIVDDRSTDSGVAVVTEWMAEHPDTPVLLLARAVNRGLARARNLAASRARSDYVMVMDADNHVYPTCLSRLVQALESDPGASMAYATLEAFGPVPGLRSAQGWHVPWLCEKNYIDAQAMIRRAVLERHDGYRVDDIMFGWEDWDLWLRMADAADYGLHVPEMLGRYRTQQSSMISMTNVAADDLRADLRERYPDLPWS